MVLSGQADLILPTLEGQVGNDRIRVGPGQFVYYPAGFAHTLEAVSDAPVNYLMLKWHTTSRVREEER